MLTPHRLAISLALHFDHSLSFRSTITARRLSALVRRLPWMALAPTTLSGRVVALDIRRV